MTCDARSNFAFKMACPSFLILDLREKFDRQKAKQLRDTRIIPIASCPSGENFDVQTLRTLGSNINPWI
jgi:hypothetical protein